MFRKQHQTTNSSEYMTRLQHQVNQENSGKNLMISGSSSNSIKRMELMKQKEAVKRKKAEKEQRKQLIALQKEKQRQQAYLRKSSLKHNMDEQEFLEQRQKEILERNGSRLQSNSLLESHNQTKNGRYYHGILTYISHPLERHYFILDSKKGTLSVFKSLRQKKPTDVIVVCQCLMSMQTDVSIVNKDLSKKFDVQPMTRDGIPKGDLLQVAVPNSTSQDQYFILIQAFMRASRLSYPPEESYWASNIVYGVGCGTQSLVTGVATGLGGVFYEPYKGAKKHGFKGGFVGVGRGLGGLIGRPVKGVFDFLAQPIVGLRNTPNFLYKKMTYKHDTTSIKGDMNFKLFGIDSSVNMQNIQDDQSAILFDLDKSENLDMQSYKNEIQNYNGEQFGLYMDNEPFQEDQKLKDSRQMTFAKSTDENQQEYMYQNLVAEEVASLNESQFQDFSQIVLQQSEYTIGSKPNTEKNHQFILARNRKSFSEDKNNQQQYGQSNGNERSDELFDDNSYSNSKDLTNAEKFDGNDFNSCIDESIAHMEFDQNLQSIQHLMEYNNQLHELDDIISSNTNGQFSDAQEEAKEYTGSFGLKEGAKADFISPSNEVLLKFIEKARNWQPIAQYDDFRCETAWKDGGFPLNDHAQMTKLRNALKQVISKVGRQILSGKFNLSQIAFPIWAMAPSSILQVYGSVSGPKAPCLARAALTDDMVTRMKHVMTASVSFLYPCHDFDKPLNPILGETYQASLEDGAMLFVEQVSHHPPISYMLLEGPNGIYRFYGYSSFDVKAHLNSVELVIAGWKKCEFPDGTVIKFNNQNDRFQNTLIGTCHHQMLGNIVFEDEKNGITGYLDIGEVYKKPKDLFTGRIEHHGETVCHNINGNYMGYADFDGERYLDIREQPVYKLTPLQIDSKSPLCLDSEARKRPDLMSLDLNEIEEAEDNKKELEVLQRHDRKLREAAEKRRKDGGAKIVYHWQYEQQQ